MGTQYTLHPEPRLHPPAADKSPPAQPVWALGGRSGPFPPPARHPPDAAGKEDAADALLKATLWAQLTAKTVEIFHEGQRVASHVRSSTNRRHTTVPEHMPASHRRYAGWTPEEIRRQATRIGPNTANLVDVILRERTHPEQGFRSCLGIVRLAKPHGRDALEAACLRALEIHGWSYKSVNSILKSEPLKAPLVRAQWRTLHRRRPEKAADGPAISHPNIRGASYYH